MKSSKTFEKIVLYSMVLLMLVLFLKFCTPNSETPTRTISSSSWRSATDEEIVKISIILGQNSITGCGEYRVMRIGEGEYKVACTSDGKNWIYYDVWTNIGKVNRTPMNEVKNFSAPK